MTERERALAAIRGDTPDRIPWIPRLEFWYRAALRKGTLPKEWRGLTLEEIALRLGAGLYALNPDYTSDVSGTVDRGLGLWHIPTLPYDFELEGVERRITKRESKNGTETVVEYVTPVGTVQTVYGRDVGCRRIYSMGFRGADPQARALRGRGLYFRAHQG